MANLNFQQPPRSIPSSSLPSSVTGRSSSAFGNTSLSGHVTPTSGMFPTGNTSFGQNQPQQSQNQQPQLSPNRNSQLSGGANSASVGSGSTTNGPQMAGSNARSNLFGGQRGFTDRRPTGISGMSNMVSFMQSRGGSSINNFHNVFDNSTAETSLTPPLLDLSEFPSLTNARGGQNDQSLPQSNSLQPPGSKPYDFRFLVGMVKQPTSEQTEFQMSNEDFPALPGTQSSDSSNNQLFNPGNNIPASQSLQGVHHHHHHHNNDHHGGDSMNKVVTSLGGSALGGPGMGMDLQNDSGNSNVSMDKGAMKRGVQTSPNGMVTNIPASMVNNQFGMVGLLTFIRAAESDPNLVTLAMGQDLTALGLNLNSVDNLYPCFGGPFSDSPARPQDIDYNVPPEYLINMSIRDKLSQLTLKKYKDDLLFYLFYTNVGDVMQLAAAAELHSRDWRYHTEEKVWITRVPGMTPYEKNGTTERGTYYYFDAQNWRRVLKEFQVDTVKLDKCPNLSAYVTMSGHTPV